MRRRLLAFAGVVALAPVAAAPRAGLALDCASSGSAGPQLDCRLRLTTPDGRPLDGARVTLGATMPSMPMAHHVATATAEPTGTAGEYRARLALEMAGDWSLQTDVAGPLRDRIVRRLRVEPCDAGRRCPAAAPASGPLPLSAPAAALPAHRH